MELNQNVTRNIFLMELFSSKRLNEMSEEEKIKKINYIMNDIERTTDIFSPIVIKDDEYYNEIEMEKQFEEEFEPYILKNGKLNKKNNSNNEQENKDLINFINKIRAKRIELSKDPNSCIELTNEDYVVLDANNINDLKKVRDMESYNRFGRTPLHEAIAMKDLKSIKKYLKNGSYLNSKDNMGYTPFEMAKVRKYKKVIELFKKYNCC